MCLSFWDITNLVDIEPGGGTRWIGRRRVVKMMA